MEPEYLERELLICAEYLMISFHLKPSYVKDGVINKQSKCSSLHMNVGKSPFTFTDCSRIKPLKRKIKVCPISRWFSRCSELLSSFLQLISNFLIRFSENIFANMITMNELALQVCHSIIKTACVLRIHISSLVPG